MMPAASLEKKLAERRAAKARKKAREAAWRAERARKKACANSKRQYANRKRLQRKQEQRERRIVTVKSISNEVLQKLKEQIRAATDPNEVLKITAAIARIKEINKPRKTAKKVEPSTPSRPAKSVRDMYTGSPYDTMSDGELVLHHLVLKIERAQLTQPGKLQTVADRGAFAKLLLAELPEAEAQAYRDLNEHHLRTGNIEVNVNG